MELEEERTTGNPLISGSTKTVAVEKLSTRIGKSAQKRLKTEKLTIKTASGKVFDANKDAIAMMGETVDCAIAKTLLAGGNVPALLNTPLPFQWIDGSAENLLMDVTYGELQEAREIADATFSAEWVI